MANFIGRFYTDNEGVEIRPGCTVAYNLSGDVVKGEVVSGPGSHKTSVYSIKHKRGVSKVKRARSILVLEEPRQFDWDIEDIVSRFGHEYGFDFVRDYFTEYPDYLLKEYSLDRIKEIIERAKNI